MDLFGGGICLKTDHIHLSCLWGKEYEGFSLKASKYISLFLQSPLSHFEFLKNLWPSLKEIQKLLPMSVMEWFPNDVFLSTRLEEVKFSGRDYSCIWLSKLSEVLKFSKDEGNINKLSGKLNCLTVTELSKKRSLYA